MDENCIEIILVLTVGYINRPSAELNMLGIRASIQYLLIALCVRVKLESLQLNH